jgi:hypothetical protein
MHQSELDVNIKLLSSYGCTYVPGKRFQAALLLLFGAPSRATLILNYPSSIDPRRMDHSHNPELLRLSSSLRTNLICGGLLQSLRANAGGVPLPCHECILPNPFPFICHPTISRNVLLKWQRDQYPVVAKSLCMEHYAH